MSSYREVEYESNEIFYRVLQRINKSRKNLIHALISRYRRYEYFDNENFSAIFGAPVEILDKIYQGITLDDFLENSFSRGEIGVCSTIKNLELVDESNPKDRLRSIITQYRLVYSSVIRQIEIVTLTKASKGRYQRGCVFLNNNTINSKILDIFTANDYNVNSCSNNVLPILGLGRFGIDNHHNFLPGFSDSKAYREFFIFVGMISKYALPFTTQLPYEKLGPDILIKVGEHADKSSVYKVLGKNISFGRAMLESLHRSEWDKRFVWVSKKEILEYKKGDPVTKYAGTASICYLLNLPNGKLFSEDKKYNPRLPLVQNTKKVPFLIFAKITLF